MKEKSKGQNLETKYWGKLLQATHRLYLIHIPMKLHKDIPSDYQVMGCTRMKSTQNKQTCNQRTIDLKQNHEKYDNCMRLFVLTYYTFL